MAKPAFLDLELAERIKEVADTLGGMGETARQINVSYPSVARWCEGTADPSRANIVKLADAAGVNIAWLATGEGSKERALTNELFISNSDYDYVPFYKIEVSAGHGAFTDGARKPTHHLAFRKRWLQAKGYYIKDLCGLIARGDSMIPAIPENAAIIVNTAYNEALDGKIYVIRIDERLWVKRTQWLPNGGLRLISDNKIYDSFDISPTELASDQVEIIGQVVHTSYDLPE